MMIRVGAWMRLAVLAMALVTISSVEPDLGTKGQGSPVANENADPGLVTNKLFGLLGKLEGKGEPEKPEATIKTTEKTSTEDSDMPVAAKGKGQSHAGKTSTEDSDTPVGAKGKGQSHAEKTSTSTSTEDSDTHVAATSKRHSHDHPSTSGEVSVTLTGEQPSSVDDTKSGEVQTSIESDAKKEVQASMEEDAKNEVQLEKAESESGLGPSVPEESAASEELDVADAAKMKRGGAGPPDRNEPTLI